MQEYLINLIILIKDFLFFIKKFSYIDEVFAQSDLDKTRLESLGAKNVKILKILRQI